MLNHEILCMILTLYIFLINLSLFSSWTNRIVSVSELMTSHSITLVKFNLWRIINLQYRIRPNSRTVVLIFFGFFLMGKMEIWHIYYLEKNSPLPLYYLKHFTYFISYIKTISFYIFDNTLILSIWPLNTIVRQLKTPVV
jgi:hypothetical protein